MTIRTDSSIMLLFFIRPMLFITCVCVNVCFRLKKDVKYNYSGPRTRDGIIDFANRVAGSVNLFS